MISFENPDVDEVFETYPLALRKKVLALRKLIFATASSTEGVGELEETLKWGEPAYLTPHTKSGSTIRIGVKAKLGTYALHFICHTNLVETFRHWFPDELHFDGNRSIVFNEDEDPPAESVATCIAAALTYHNRKKSK
ncbi:MAG: DUF1801 domain-containing protein [Longimicrobiales bacterium]